MDKKITKSNAVINSSYRLSLNELRIVLYGLSHINPCSKEFPLFYKINIRELAEFYNIGEKDRGSFYDDIKHALIDKFWEREFSYFDDELGETVKRRWLIEVRYGGKNGILSYHYNPMIKDQLQSLAKRFTSYFLTNVANMKSAYAFRIYEIAIMHLNASNKNKAKFTKSIKELKKSFSLEGKYKHFFNFKNKVLEIAKRDIDIHSDINISYKVIKLGRTPYEIEFTVARKKEAKQLSAPPKTNIKSPNPSSIKLAPSTLENAQNIISSNGGKYDLYEIEKQFYDFVKKKGKPDNLEGAFIGFVKKKITISV